MRELKFTFEFHCFFVFKHVSEWQIIANKNLSLLFIKSTSFWLILWNLMLFRTRFLTQQHYKSVPLFFQEFGNKCINWLISEEFKVKLLSNYSTKLVSNLLLILYLNSRPYFYKSNNAQQNSVQIGVVSIYLDYRKHQMLLLCNY